MSERVNINDQAAAARDAQDAYNRAVWPLVAPYVERVIEWAEDPELIHEDVLGLDSDGIAIAVGGPGVTLLWNGRVEFVWNPGLFEWRPETAAQQDAIETVLGYCREALPAD